MHSTSQGYLQSISLVSVKKDNGEIDAMIKDEPFKAKFKGISSSVSVKKDNGEIDAITGATISSRAICRAVSNGLKLFMEQKEEIWKK